MYNMANGEGYCYIWDESISGRGACEIASCIYSFLKDCAAKGVNEVVLYSDNCSGQNRNRFLVSMYAYVLHSTAFHTIRQNYLEKGHTQNENDCIHATIEHEKNILLLSMCRPSTLH